MRGGQNTKSTAALMGGAAEGKRERDNATV